MTSVPPYGGPTVGPTPMGVLMMMTTTTLVVVILLTVLTTLVRPAEASFELTLMHTGHSYAQLTAIDQYDQPCEPVNGTYLSTLGANPCFGGLDRRKAVVDRVRASATNSLLIDSGGLFTGSLFWYLFNSTILTPYYRAMGYDAVGLSAYEFLRGVEPVVYFIKHMDGTPAMAANLENWQIDPRFDNQTVYAYAVFSFGGAEKVGYAVTLVPHIAHMFTNSYPIDSGAELAAILKAVADLQNLHGVNKIIVTLSASAEVPTILDAVVGIDIVVQSDVFYGQNATWEPDEAATPIGDYPHVYETPWGQKVLIVGCGNYGRYMGVLNVTFDDYGVPTAWPGNSVQLNEAVGSDAALYANITQAYARLEADMSLVIGTDTVALGFQESCLFGECAIGDWAADEWRAFGKTQIAFVNGGSFSHGLPKGPLTLGEFVVAFPFGGTDQLWSFALSGQAIYETLEHSVALATTFKPYTEADTGRFLQTAGLNFTWNPNDPPGSRVVDIWVEVAPGDWQLLIDPTATYTVTSIDYLVISGGDYYQVLVDEATNLTNLQVFSNVPLLDAYRAGPVDVQIDGHISTTNYTRNGCYSSNDTLCNGNGYCYQGSCVCTVSGASGALCTTATSADSSGALSSGAIAGIVVGALVPIVLLIVVLSLITLWAVVYAMRKKVAYGDDWTVDFAELELAERLGQGGFGEVRKASWKGTEVAVKIIPQSVVAKALVASFTQEARIMSKLRHPNVVLFMGASVKPPNLCIVMEYMALGSLYDLLHNDLVSDIPFGLRIKLTYQAAKGMHFLHSAGMVHRDLKSLNLLLDTKWNLKVADFGISTFKDSLKPADEQTVGSIFWMAPEVLAEEENVDYVLADVYSFGIVLWEVLTRAVLYEGLSQPQVAIGVITQGLRPPLPQHISTESELQYTELIRSCWQQDVQRRPIFLNVMNELESMLEEGTRNATTTNSSSSSSTGSLYARSQSKRSGATSSGVWNRTNDWSYDYSSDRSGQAAPPRSPTVSDKHAPRQDVSYVICDLVGLNRMWKSNPVDAERLIELYGRLVKAHAARHHGHLFSRSTFHSGGTFMLSFGTAGQAAAFAMALSKDVLTDATTTLRQHSRISASHQPGTNKAPKYDPMRTSYEQKDYAEACRLNTVCPPGAVLCSPTVHDLLQETHSFKPLGNNYILVLPQAAAAGENSEEAEEEVFSDLPQESEMGLCSSNSCPWIIDLSSLYVGEPIGEGSYGQVFKAVYMDNMHVAVKRLYNSRLDDEIMRCMRREAAMLFDLEHPNIVKLIGLSIGSGAHGVSNVTDSSLMLVMELVPGRNLRALLSDSKKPLSWKLKLTMLLNAALGVAYLHERDIIHRDIKSSNLLLDDNNMSVKVGDFGFATAKQQNTTMTRCGTPAWTAPELLVKPEGDHSHTYDEKVDVYSFGIVMWEVLTRKYPYADVNMVHLIKQVLDGNRPTIPADCPGPLADMMKRCWHRKPRKRPTMEDVVIFLNAQLDSLDI